MADEAQMLMPEGVRVGPAHLLWLATGAGAAALGLGHEVGDLTPGTSADLVLIAPPADSTLATVLARSESVEDQLGAMFTLAREESIAEVSIAEVRVAGEAVWRGPSQPRSLS